MRRDIVLGLAASFAIHGVVWVIGRVPNAAPMQLLVKDENLPPFVMKPIEPDKPEPVEVDSTPKPSPDLAPPSLPDAPQIVRPDSFVEPMRPPQPDDLKRTDVINIPTNLGSGGGGNGKSIFTLADLDQPPSARYQAKPVYPFEQRRNGTKGQVVVGFVVDASGNVQNVYVVNSSMREFEAAAVQAVGKWKFRPGRKGGVAVGTRMQVPVVFSISEEQE